MIWYIYLYDLIGPEAKYGDDVSIPGLPLWPSISIPLEAHPTNSSSIWWLAPTHRDGYLDQV